jgi:hydrogenase maturation protease
MHLTRPKILVIGYGNPGRCDDGLGQELGRKIEDLGIDGVTVEYDYQLMVDHAAQIAESDIVVFADAMVGLDVPYKFSAIVPANPQVLGSHQVSPEAVLALAQLLFGGAPSGWLLAIAGEEFGEVREGLSTVAGANLLLAVDFLNNWLVAQNTAVVASSGGAQ